MFTTLQIIGTLCQLLLFLSFQPVSLAQGPACTTGPICSPKAGDVWLQDSLSPVIWNTDATAPFDKYDKVDIYIYDHTTQTGTKLLSDQDLSLGMAAVTLESGLFPDNLPVNRSAHILLTLADNNLDGTHQTLNSSTFFLIRTKQSVSGTLVPLPSATSSTTATSTFSLSSSSSSSTAKSPKATSPIASPNSPNSPNSPPTNIPEAPESKSSTLSPLVIGLISAGCAALLIAILALGLLFRARRRYKGDNTSYFKSLHDHPSSPSEPSKSSIFQNDDVDGSFVGPTFGAIAGRNSSNTARSGEPMLKNGLFNNYNNQSTVSTTAPLPLLERKGSAAQKEEVQPTPIPTVIVGGYESGATTTRGSQESKSAPKLEPVLSAGDAALIAETFRKSMRRPRWDDVEEEDEARKAANELLRKELSEEGVDVRRGVQRRVTIQDRTDRAHRSSVAPPLAESDEH